MELKEIIYKYLKKIEHDFKLKDGIIFDKWSMTIDACDTAINLSKIITKDTEKFDEFSKIYYVNEYFSNIWGDDTSNALDEYGIKIYLYVFVNRTSGYIRYWVENKNDVYIFGNL